jgi:hypothetical protein
LASFVFGIWILHLIFFICHVLNLIFSISC